MTAMLHSEVSHAAQGNAREILSRINTLTRARPDLHLRYRAAKDVIHAFRKPAFYEITQRCNLWCEGCYYFEVGERQRVREESSIEAWEEFYAAEAERRVSMAYFVEPSLRSTRSDWSRRAAGSPTGT